MAYAFCRFHGVAEEQIWQGKIWLGKALTREMGDMFCVGHPLGVFLGISVPFLRSAGLGPGSPTIPGRNSRSHRTEPREVCAATNGPHHPASQLQPVPKIISDFIHVSMATQVPISPEGYHGDFSWLCPQLRQALFLSWQAGLTGSQVRGLELGLAKGSQGVC